MKRGQETEGVIERMDFPNRGRLESEGNIITVKNALPGQMIRARITRKKAGRIEGKLMEVICESPIRTERPCPHSDTCGGCLYQGFPYESELEIKSGQIRRLLSPVVGEERYDRIYDGIIKSPSADGYRNKMELTFGDEKKDGPLTLGMHARGSFYDITPTRNCGIMTGDMRKVLELTLDFFTDKNISYYHRRTHRGYLRHLLLRQAANTGQLLVDLVTSTDCVLREGTGFDEEKLLEEWKSLVSGAEYTGTLAGILHTRNDSVADVITDGGTDVLFGEDFFHEEILGLKFKITPFSFFQTNSRGAELLYRKAREYIFEACGGKPGRVFDLYSGTGTITQLLAAAAEEAVGVELVPEAVDAAVENAVLNHIDNVSFICGDVLKVLRETDKVPDTIVLDPPRDGIHPKALPQITGYGVENILYISCKATSLARDLPFFMQSGYEPVRLSLIDMFPRTGGVETMVALHRADI